LWVSAINVNVMNVSNSEHARGLEEGFVDGEVVGGGELGGFMALDDGGEFAEVGDLQESGGEIEALPVGVA